MVLRVAGLGAIVALVALDPTPDRLAVAAGAIVAVAAGRRRR